MKSIAFDIVKRILVLISLSMYIFMYISMYREMLLCVCVFYTYTRIPV